MLSIVIIILLIQQFYPTYQLEAVQAAISSTVELPCSVINQNIESTNPAKVNTKKRRQVFMKRTVSIGYIIIIMMNAYKYIAQHESFFFI
jgi:hypothetical protein